ncbi:MAG: hypothetical protein QM647_11540 [Asticcacaulis sp.]|uniref:hypothetical protein n=1 Tax=Asticcacaulis sp. TaxID=1872648 RepID=UPI0039E67A38
MKKLIIPMAIGLMMAATAVCAQQAPDGPPPGGPQGGPPKAEDLIARLDTDKDGAISKAEAAADSRFAEHFDMIDADHDGKVTAAELTDAFSKMKPPSPPQQ